MRIGIGTDCHRLAQGKPLRIGGITIPAPVGPVAHSDGDVLLHALTDALLGAAALGDIGRLFPDSDPANQGRDSAEFVTAALGLLRHHGWIPLNADCTVHLQRPKLAPFHEHIRRRIAELLDVTVDLISVKAKSGEGIGPVGRGESIEALVVVLVGTEANRDNAGRGVHQSSQ